MLARQKPWVFARFGGMYRPVIVFSRHKA